MTTPAGATPSDDTPEDPEVISTGLDSAEDYGPPEIVDPDREANEADQIEQVIEAPHDDDGDAPLEAQP